MAAVGEVMDTINTVCRARGGHYARYSCKVVSWDDVSRGTVGGALSCWGANITDTYLKSKSGASLFTVRSDNWNEKLGVVRAEDVAVVAGSGGGPLQPVTLRTVLQQLGQFGSYAGLDSSADLSNPELDAKCSIRFQTTFIPVDGPDGCGKLEFATEAYNYNTMDDADPRNLVLLCTSQGMAVQQDGRGTKKLFHHAADDSGVIHRYWLEAEESRHHVGGEQRETAEERAVALARGKATSSVIGTRAMGQRFNVLMTIQVPLQQSRQPQKRLGGKGLGRGKGGFGVGGGMDSLDALFGMVKFKAAAPAQDFRLSRGERESFRPRRKLGHSSAARVSRGSEHDTWSGLTAKSAKRNPSEHVTVTVVIYNAVKGGVPSAGDVMAAIDDLESLYRACAETGKLADSTFDFMKGSNVVVLRLGRWPFGDAYHTAFTLGYEALFVLSIWSHLACMLTDPGACPRDVEYAEGERHCTKCRAPKPARAHHCSTCQRCIMKMDHHCPWVNNCVGARNQKHFLQFLFYTAMQCVLAGFALGAHFADSAVSLPRRPRRPQAFLGKEDTAEMVAWREELKKYSEHQVRNEADLLCCVMVFFVAIIFGLFTCIMFCDQASNIANNTTGIDVMKGKEREPARPWRESVQEVMGRGPSWRWLLPTPLRQTQEE
ncbi:unnamed protein product [Effrenium voratum]|nr:unnamed protein product [Effrenium voratum]